MILLSGATDVGCRENDLVNLMNSLLLEVIGRSHAKVFLKINIEDLLELIAFDLDEIFLSD